MNRCANRRLVANSPLRRHSSVSSTCSASSSSDRRRNSSQQRVWGPGSTRRSGGGAFVLRQFSTNRLTVRLLPRYPSAWTSLYRLMRPRYFAAGDTNLNTGPSRIASSGCHSVRAMATSLAVAARASGIDAVVERHLDDLAKNRSVEHRKHLPGPRAGKGVAGCLAARVRVIGSLGGLNGV
jgi:hypothetical protein